MLFEALWLLLIWVISPFVSDGFALIISPIAAIAVSLAMLPGISYIYSILKKKDLFDPKMASFVLYGISYLLTLYLTVVLLEKFVWTFHIDEIKNVEFALQAIPSILLYSVFSETQNNCSMGLMRSHMACSWSGNGPKIGGLQAAC